MLCRVPLTQVIKLVFLAILTGNGLQTKNATTMPGRNVSVGLHWKQ